MTTLNINLLQTSPGRRHLHYANYTERSGPFILSLRKATAVNAADKWAAGTDKQRFARVIHYTWDAAGLRAVKYFYERPFVVKVKFTL
jgi:hypothetical protein